MLKNKEKIWKSNGNIIWTIENGNQPNLVLVSGEKITETKDSKVNNKMTTNKATENGQGETIRRNLRFDRERH